MLALEEEIGLRDKTLSEFVLTLARDSKSVNDFEKALEENGAEFTIDLINSLYAMITRLLPDPKRQLSIIEPETTIDAIH